MLQYLLLAGSICCALFSSAEARQRHPAPVKCAETGNIMIPVCGMVQPFSGAVTIRVVMHRERPKLARRLNLVRRLNETNFSAPSPSLGYTLARPARYIAGRLICAVNVGAALAERGIKGTGSALALSYLHWGHSAGGPVPGAVIVSARRGGGHVAIVSRVENGIVYAWNATGGQSGWREIPYRHRVIDYRMPG